MKTFNEFMTEAKKDRVIGTFKVEKGVEVVVLPGVFGGKKGYLNVAVRNGSKTNVISRGLNKDMTDSEIIKKVKTGAWASNFKRAGGVNWAK